ncbi:MULTISPECIES: hypothetical protein [Aeromonas]|uniref:hypothetical protein n=1 Tax=Aeromonas TaxID=642 RepID=UPI000CDDE900|nr:MULTISPECIES: hypothetical protein [Aeromonas]AUZ76257.1 hypothetical protein C2U40_16345 [Aeromonas sp. ASNIH4]POU36251.1 hypothetical protein C3405_17440 [Aeromonas hydrophila]POV85950.1 hypothetical protein C3395_21870 [Aeromonas sp. ASNIH6]
MTNHNLSMQLTKLFEAYCIALSLRDMVRVRVRLVRFAHRAHRFNQHQLASEALMAAGQLGRDIQKVLP